MKIYCRYTGLEIMTASGFDAWESASIHPIFSAPIGKLMDVVKTKWSPAYPELDKKLLLLAIAHGTDLIKWDDHRPSFALPTLATVESSISKLVYVAGWIFSQRRHNKFREYPCYVVDRDTFLMQSFPTMLGDIIASREENEKAEWAAHRAIVLEDHHRMIAGKCRIGMNREARLLKTTAEWAMLVTADALDAERVSDNIREYWKEMLQTSPERLRAMNYNLNDVIELRDFLTDNLPHGSVIAHDVIAHCDALARCNIINGIDHISIKSARIASTLLGSPMPETPEPMRAAFSNVLDFARAKARWQLERAVRDESN